MAKPPATDGGGPVPVFQGRALGVDRRNKGAKPPAGLAMRQFGTLALESRTPPMKRPLLLALALTLAGLVLSLLPTLWHLFTTPPGAVAPPAQGTPWQVVLPAPGQSAVFGLRLPGSTLGEARVRWAEDITAAVLVDASGAVSLEAYVERLDAGGVQGRLVLSFEPATGPLQAWRETLPREPTPSGGWRHKLNAQAWQDLGPAALVGLGFIPAAQLDAGVLSARFGEPAARVAGAEHQRHWLYPAQGLAIVLDDKGRELLQYVAPADFERRLAAPLKR